VLGQVAQLFSPTDYLLSLPIVLLTIFALGILIIDLWVPTELKWFNAVTAFIGTLFSLYVVVKIHFFYLSAPSAANGLVGFAQSMLLDRFALYFYYLFLVATLIAILTSVRYLEIEREHHGEYYALMLFAVVGMMCMASAIDVVLLFIGLELMAISTYVLVGFLRRDRRSNEAALKYLLLGAFSSGIFAYGLSLLYGLTGSTNLFAINQRLGQLLQVHPKDPIAIIALITTATGLLFKIAAFPFHQWAPDAYEGAPTTITGFMSVAVKAAAWAMLIRVLFIGFASLQNVWVPMMIFVSIATMTGANLAALTQTNTKRLLAYSSIAHVGYILLGVVAFGSGQNPAAADGLKGILIYLLVYTFMNLGAFAVIASLRRRDIIGDEIDDIAGLYSRAPFEAVLMLIFLLSLAGIPPMAGFLAKYFIFLSLIESQHYVLAAVAVLYALFGLYYYMKIASAMFMRQPLESEALPVSWGMRFALGITAFATIYIGIMPEQFIRAVNWTLGLNQVSSVISQLK
jgi:NADH-quinone oxidoreductase subunit N